MTRAVLLALFLFGLAGAAVAQIVDPPLDDPALEARAIELHKQLRCLVCQNQSIHDSNAELARDLRIVVRERLAAGDTDDQAVQYLVARYGDWVLLRPPLKPATLLLWLGPLVILLAAGAGAAVFLRRASGAAPEPLSDAERARLRELLKEP